MASQVPQDAKAGLGPGVTTQHSPTTLQSGPIGDTKCSSTYDVHIGRAGDATNRAKKPSTVEMEGPEGSIRTDRKLSAEYTARVLARSRAGSTVLPSDVDPEAGVASQDSRHRSESVTVHGTAPRHFTDDTEEPLAPGTDKKGGSVEGVTPPGSAIDGGHTDSTTAEEISDANPQRSRAARRCIGMRVSRLSCLPLPSCIRAGQVSDATTDQSAGSTNPDVTPSEVTTHRQEVKPSVLTCTKTTRKSGSRWNLFGEQRAVDRPLQQNELEACVAALRQMEEEKAHAVELGRVYRSLAAAQTDTIESLQSKVQSLASSLRAAEEAKQDALHGSRLQSRVVCSKALEVNRLERELAEAVYKQTVTDNDSVLLNGHCAVTEELCARLHAEVTSTRAVFESAKSENHQLRTELDKLKSELELQRRRAVTAEDSVYAAKRNEKEAYRRVRADKAHYETKLADRQRELKVWQDAYSDNTASAWQAVEVARELIHDREQARLVRQSRVTAGPEIRNLALRQDVPTSAITVEDTMLSLERDAAPGAQGSGVPEGERELDMKPPTNTGGQSGMEAMIEDEQTPAVPKASLEDPQLAARAVNVEDGDAERQQVPPFNNESRDAPPVVVEDVERPAGSVVVVDDAAILDVEVEMAVDWVEHVMEVEISDDDASVSTTESRGPWSFFQSFVEGAWLHGMGR